VQLLDVPFPNLVQGGVQGYPAIFEENGVYTVKDADGTIRYVGGEVAAEFAYWRSLLGVPDDSEVML
jgi:hypothetical protein